MDQIYLDLIENYKSDKMLISSIRKYILDSLGKKLDVLDYIDYFRESAISINDKIGEAFSHAMLFWLYNVIDPKKAKNENDIAKSIYLSLDDYKNQYGFLTVLNNELVYFNTVGDIKSSYFTAYNALKILNETNQVDYFVALSNNYIFILFELGLFEKAYNCLKDSKQLAASVSRLTLINTEFVFVLCCIYLKKYDEATKALDYLEQLNETPIIVDSTLFLSQRLIIALNSKSENTKAIYEELILKIQLFDKENMDILYIYHAIGLYLYSINDYKNALIYYKKIYKYIKYYPVLKKDVLLELSQIYEKLHNYKNASKIKTEAIEGYIYALNSVGKILDVTSGDISETFNNMSYKDLYRKIDIINTYSNEISNDGSIESIYKYIYDVISSIYNDNTINFVLVIKNDNINKYIIIDNQKKEYKLIKEKALDDLKYKNRIEIKNDNLLAYLYLETRLYIDLNNKNDINDKFMIKVGKLVENYLSYDKAVIESRQDHLTKIQNMNGLKTNINLFDNNKTKYFIVLDIDDFKSINDLYGHPVGDNVLRIISSLLTDLFSYDYCARIGGDEFGIIYFGEKDLLINKFNKLLSNLNEIKIENFNKKITVSIGAKKLNNIEEYENIYELADKNMYRIKKTTKNGYYIED